MVVGQLPIPVPLSGLKQGEFRDGSSLKGRWLRVGD